MGRAKQEKSNMVDGTWMQIASSLNSCVMPPEITQQDFKGGWSPAIAHRCMSQQITGDYYKWDPICAHRLVWSGETSVTHLHVKTPDEDSYAYASFMYFPAYC